MTHSSDPLPWSGSQPVSASIHSRDQRQHGQRAEQRADDGLRPEPSAHRCPRRSAGSERRLYRRAPGTAIVAPRPWAGAVATSRAHLQIGSLAKYAMPHRAVTQQKHLGAAASGDDLAGSGHRCAASGSCEDRTRPWRCLKAPWRRTAWRALFVPTRPSGRSPEAHRRDERARTRPPSPAIAWRRPEPYVAGCWRRRSDLRSRPIVMSPAAPGSPGLRNSGASPPATGPTDARTARHSACAASPPTATDATTTRTQTDAQGHTGRTTTWAPSTIGRPYGQAHHRLVEALLVEGWPHRHADNPTLRQRSDLSARPIAPARSRGRQVDGHRAGAGQRTGASRGPVRLGRVAELGSTVPRAAGVGV